jgi:hypothetical protein
VPEAEFPYSGLLPTGAAGTPYHLITAEGASEVEGPDGQLAGHDQTSFEV